MNEDSRNKQTGPFSVPFERSYWIVPGKFLAGCYPGDLAPNVAMKKRSALLDAGITDFVSLMEANEVDHSRNPFDDYWPKIEKEANKQGQNIAFHRFPIVDGNVPTIEQMRAIITTINTLMGCQRSIYVHCWGGRGRTGTVVACWLMQQFRLNKNESVKRLHSLIGERIELFQPTPETEPQRAFLNQWETRP